MDQEAIREIANRPGAGVDYPAGHLADFATQAAMTDDMPEMVRNG